MGKRRLPVLAARRGRRRRGRRAGEEDDEAEAADETETVVAEIDVERVQRAEFLE